MHKMKALAAILSLFLTLPIWFYLLYKILVLVNATELMWFLYWAYVPATMAVSGIAKLMED